MTREKVDSFIKSNKLKNPTSRVYCVERDTYLVINDNEIFINDKCVYTARPDDEGLTSLPLPRILFRVIDRLVNSP